MKHDITSRNGFLSRKIKAIPLALGLALCASLLVSSTVFSGPNPGLVLTSEDLRALPRNEVVILDTRSSWKYLLGHLPGARPAGDWRDFVVKQGGIQGLLNRNKTFLVGKLKALGIDKDKTIVLYGDPTDKWRTDGRFFWMFEYLGFPKVAILEGGLESWSAKNLEVERGLSDTPAASKLKEEDLHFNDRVHADRTWIRDRLDPGPAG